MTTYWGENLARLRKEKGWNQKQLSEESGISQGQISHLEKGKRGFKQSPREPILNALNCTLADIFVESAPAATPQTKPANQDFSLIPKYKAKLSGGPGYLNPSDKVDANLSFRTEFIRSKGSKNDMALFEVSGDSMEPFIWHQDVVMVDMSHKDPKDIINGKVYAFRFNSTVLVKRLVWQGKKLMAISENKELYDPYEIEFDEDFELIGKVAWVGHEIN